MGGSGVDSRRAFVSAAAGPAAERLVACSIDTFSCRAADLSCGADGRHRQVAHGGKRGGSATQIRSERGVLHQRTLRGALSAIDYRGRRGPAGGGHFTQPASRRGDYRQCCRPLSGRERTTHTRVARIDSVTGIFARSATGASATCVDRRPSGRSRSFFYGADTEPAILAWPLAKIAAVMPITQGGIGVREAALVVLLAPFGAPASQVLATGIVWEGVIITAGLLAGLTAFLLRYSQTRIQGC